MTKAINVGIAGFGMSAQTFHAPFLDIDPHFCIKKVFERSTNQSQQSYPYIELVRDFTELLTDEIDLVIITTPNQTHYPYVKQALLADKHVVVEKPFVIHSEQAIELAQLAQQKKSHAFYLSK